MIGRMLRQTAIVLVATAAFDAPAALAQTPAQIISGSPQQETMKVPAPDGSGRMLIVTIMRPRGNGPFPLAIVNHGSPPTADARTTMEPPTMRSISHWLLARGYVVALPLRRGYGAVGGRWDEGYGPCDRADFVKGGRETARDIEAVRQAMVKQSHVSKTDAIVVGVSAGGWGSIAHASQNTPGVVAYINFSGGRGGWRGNKPHNNCSPDALETGAREFGMTARAPTLWLYAENDTFFGPDLVRRMHAAFRAGGGDARLQMFSSYGRDGHRLGMEESAVPLWAPHAQRFLDGIGSALH